MSSPHTPDDGRRAENIKQYYQQLCANYRLVSQQLQHPDLPPARRPVLQSQLEKLQQALQEFTDKVIKPIISANKVSPRGTPQQKPRPGPMIGAPPSTPREGQIGVSMGIRPLKVGAVVGQSTQQYLDQTKLVEGVLVEVGPSRGRTIGTDMGSSGRLSDLFPNLPLSRGLEDLLLTATDRYLGSVCQGICESARHRKRPGISMKDLEIVISKELGMSITTVGVPYAVAPSGAVKSAKKAASGGPHNTRLLQLRKHLSQQ